MEKNKKIDTQTMKKLIKKYEEQNKALEKLLKKLEKKNSKTSQEKNKINISTL